MSDKFLISFVSKGGVKCIYSPSYGEYL